MQKKKEKFIIGLVLIFISIFILVISLVLDPKSPIGYIIFGLIFAFGFVFTLGFIFDSSLKKELKKEFENRFKNENLSAGLSITQLSANSENVYFEVDDKGNKVYVSIFKRKVVLDFFSKDEARKIDELSKLKDESLKKEGFMYIMNSKKSTIIKIKSKNVDEIMNNIEKEILNHKYL